MPGSFVVMGQNVNGESAQEAENVQDAIRLLTEHPEAQSLQGEVMCWSRSVRESGQEWNLSVFMGWMN